MCARTACRVTGVRRTSENPLGKKPAGEVQKLLEDKALPLPETRCSRRDGGAGVCLGLIVASHRRLGKGGASSKASWYRSLMVAEIQNLTRSCLEGITKPAGRIEGS
ncbi:hypothetical protein E2C01_039360 [Portunus trituberculatus]|uniref:Uncharacterized protein n=1 Tax=Portunus trituberculatus TaxID=210409 RepID=A0A5B7FMU7_PORTR|nr:hypothetical protein [Portunus trituberculatus]